jgi:hypothetical protein
VQHAKKNSVHIFVEKTHKMWCLEGSGVSVLYIGRRFLNVKQLYKFRAFFAHPQEFLYFMVSRSFPLRQCYGRTDRTILATGYQTTRPHSHTFAINYERPGSVRTPEAGRGNARKMESCLNKITK